MCEFQVGHPDCRF